MTMHESFMVFVIVSYLFYILLGAIIGFVFGVDCGLSRIQREAIELGYAEHAKTGEWKWKHDVVE